jgi:hypothetical protein
MTKRQSLIGSLLVAILVAAAILFTHPTFGHANPSYFVRSNAVPGTATTSLKYMTVGTATTTITNDVLASSLQAINVAVLQLAIKSSTTAPTLFGTTTLSIRIEQSDNNLDWTLSTSSTLQTTATEQVGDLALASTTVTMRTISIPTTLRYVRAFVGVQPGSSNNAAVWGQFVGQRENN